VANPDDAEAIDGLSRQPEIIDLLRTTCVTTQVSGGHAPIALLQRATGFDRARCGILGEPGSRSVALAGFRPRVGFDWQNDKQQLKEVPCVQTNPCFFSSPAP
jgi:hypothetical protein